MHLSLCSSEVLISIVIAFSCSFVPIDIKDQTRHYGNMFVYYIKQLKLVTSTDMAIGIICVTEIGS